MHPCLKLTEILTIIFDELVNEGDKVDRFTLNNLTTTCKTFHEPAVEKLWATLESLRPLFECLPDRLWGKNWSAGCGDFTLKENPSLDDMTRFIVCARRVLHLSGDIEADPAAIRTLGLLTNAPLLPNLRSITTSEPDDYPMLPMILGPRTEALYLSVFDDKTIEFLWSWRDSHPLIKKLSFFNHPRNNQIAQAMADLVGKCQLEEFYGSRPSQFIFAHLATSPFLRKLRLRDFRIRDLALVTQPSFVHLSSLELVAVQNASYFKPFLELIGPCCLKRLLLATPLLANTADHWVELLSLLRDNCSHSSLESLHIKLNMTEPVLFNYFEPLLAFHNLKEVTIMNDRGILLDDEDITRFATAWPQLEILCLETQHMPDEQERQMTLEGLVSLLGHCPYLKQITLASINVDHFPQVAPSFDILEINVGNSLIEKSAIFETASFLSTIFPRLFNIHSWLSFEYDSDLGGKVGLFKGRWWRVGQLVRSMILVERLGNTCL